MMSSAAVGGGGGGATAAAADGPDKKCIPCSTMDESFLLKPDELPGLVSSRIPLWTLAPDAKSISRYYTARNFQAALDSINAVGAIAEEQSHHPDLHLTGYRNVEIVLWTHKLGGLTESDVTLAELFDQQVTIDYSPKWLKEHPEAERTAKKA